MAGEHCRRDPRAWYVSGLSRVGPNEPDVRWLRSWGAGVSAGEVEVRPTGLEGHVIAQVPSLCEPFRKPLPVPIICAGSGGRCCSCELLVSRSLSAKTSEHRPRARYKGPLAL